MLKANIKGSTIMIKLLKKILTIKNQVANHHWPVVKVLFLDAFGFRPPRFIVLFPKSFLFFSDFAEEFLKASDYVLSY